VVGVADTAGTGAESGVTIDARQLDATHSFSYNGEEGPTPTADRFIMADANINGAAIIDGGAVLGALNVGSHLPNADVLEVRDAAVVTIGDLANIKNVSNLSFTNDTATVQNSILQLDTATIDALVNSSLAATTVAPENLTITVVGNGLVPGADTNLTIDATTVDFTKTTITVTATNGVSVNFTAGATSNTTFVGTTGNDIITGGAGNDTLSGGAGNDTINGGAGNDVINGGTNTTTGHDTLVGAAGNDTFVFAAGATDTFAQAASAAAVDVIGPSDLALGGVGAGTRVDALDLVEVVANVNGSVTGTVNEATFIADLNTLLNVAGGNGFNTAVAGDISAAIVFVTGGTLNNHTFLAVDTNASDTFTAADFIVDVTGFTGTLDVSDFI